MKNQGKIRHIKTHWPYILIGTALVLIAGAGVVFGTSQARQGDSPPGNQAQTIFPPAEINRPAPELTLEALDGQQVSLQDYRGEVVLVNNWATWCPPCKAEMPELNAYFQEHKNQGFQVIAIEAGDPPQQVKSFVEREGIDFLVLLDPENKALKRFENASLPNT